MADNSNPGNFANRSKEEVQNIASKGGQTGTENSGFASMAKDKVVSNATIKSLSVVALLTPSLARHCLSGWSSQLRQLREGQ